MAKDHNDIKPQIPSNLSRRFVEIQTEDQKHLVATALVRAKLSEAEAQKIHQNAHTFGASAFEIDGDKINQVPIETIAAKKRGPKPSGAAKSSAERVAAYRAKKRRDAENQ